MRWLTFFLGTPQRFLRTVLGLFIGFAMIMTINDPEYPARVVSSLFNALWPLIQMAIVLLFVYWGIQVIVSGGKGGKK
jgi:hypothetical protein